MIVYRCEDSAEAIFTSIYLAYEEHRDHSDTMILTHQDPILFAQDISVTVDEEKWKKVHRTLLKRFGEADTQTLYKAMNSCGEDKAQAVYQTIVNGICKNKSAGHLLDDLSNPFVMKTFAYARTTHNEIFRWMEILRFRQCEADILCASIYPDCNILADLMPHFADRFPQENFLIYDEKRSRYGVHPRGKQWYVQSGVEEKRLQDAATEQFYVKLFQGFVQAIAIEGRQNISLQDNHLPKKYRKHMTEFRQERAE